MAQMSIEDLQEMKDILARLTSLNIGEVVQEQSSGHLYLEVEGGFLDMEKYMDKMVGSKELLDEVKQLVVDYNLLSEEYIRTYGILPDEICEPIKH